jgi:hypothetical protein
MSFMTLINDRMGVVPGIFAAQGSLAAASSPDPAVEGTPVTKPERVETKIKHLVSYRWPAISR